MGLNQSVSRGQGVDPAFQFSKFDASLIWIALLILISIIVGGSASLFVYCYWTGKRRGFQLSPAASLLNISVVQTPSFSQSQRHQHQTVDIALDMNSLPLITVDNFSFSISKPSTTTQKLSTSTFSRNNCQQTPAVSPASPQLQPSADNGNCVSDETSGLVVWHRRLWRALVGSGRRGLTKIRRLDFCDREGDGDDSSSIAGVHNSAVIGRLGTSLESQKKVLEYLL